MPWSFSGISFERVLGGPSDPQWFPAQIQRSVDLIAGDVAATPRRYVDLGARALQPLSLLAAGTAAQRDALVNALGQRATLTSATGRSCTALLVRADPLAPIGTPRYYQVQLEFEFIQ